MTVQQLIERIFRLTNNEFTDKFEMIDLMNDAQNILANKLEGSADISVVSGTSKYALPATFKAPLAMVEGELSQPDNVYPLLNIDEDDFGYAIYNGFVYFKPEPAENKTVTQYYYKYPTQLASPTDTPEIDSEWHHLLAIYAAAMLKGDDRLMNQWSEGERMYSAAMMRKHRKSRVRDKVIW